MNEYLDPRDLPIWNQVSTNKEAAQAFREAADILDPPTPKRITLVIEEGRNGVLYFHGATIEPLAEDAE